MKQQEIKRKQIICYTYIIGMLGMIGMGKILGDGGLAYLAVAMEAISLFTLLVTFGVSDVIARLQRNRRNKGQFKGAARMRGQFLLLQGVTGALLSAVLLLMADTLAQKVFQVPYSASAMKMLAPVILFQALDAALLGYFLGSGSYMPSLVSAVLRQGFFLVLGSLFGRRLADYGDKVSNLLKNSNYSGMYGAMGVALGILITELLVFLFLVIVYMVSDRKADEQRSQEGLRRTESMGDIVRVFCGALWQGTCTALLALLPVLLGAVFYLRSIYQLYSQVSALVPAADPGEGMVWAADAAVTGYGSFFGKCFLLCGVFVVILAARCLSVYGRLHSAIHREDVRYTRDVASSGLHYVWVVGLYFAVTMAVMAPQMAAGFFPGRDAGVDGMLRTGGVMILLTGLVILLSMVLLAHGERYILMGLLGVWVILDLILQKVFVKGSDYSAAGILSAALAAMALLLAALLGYCVWQSRINTEYIRILGVPLVGAGIMGLAMMMATKLLSAHMSNVMSVVAAALLGAIVYGVILVMTRNIREYEISVLYGKQARKLLGRIFS